MTLTHRFLFLLVFALAASVAFAQEALTNESVIKMVKAGLSEAIITATVEQQPGNYSTKVEDLIALKQAGVSDKVVELMVRKASGTESVLPVSPETTATENGAAPPSLETGVYYRKQGKWTEVLPEIVNWKTGGTLKNLASAGVVKKDMNGNLTGPASRNTVKSPLEFLIVVTEGVAVTEYQLIRLRLNKDYREFRTITGGIFNQQSGAMRDMVPFEGKRVAPRTYAVTLPGNLGVGEYGFLAPGAVGASGNTAAQIGKMYTFRIVE